MLLSYSTFEHQRMRCGQFVDTLARKTQVFAIPFAAPVGYAFSQIKSVSGGSARDPIYSAGSHLVPYLYILCIKSIGKKFGSIEIE